MLSATDLSVELGGLPVLRQISMAVTAGNAVALLGGNGSGKSTLVRALLGLTPISRGAVQLFGTDLSRFSQWSRIGYVPQRSTIDFTRAKVSEVVGSGRLSHRAPFLPARQRDRQAVTEALQVVRLTDRTGRQMQQLSGGQQQRVLIARALAAQPQLLVLDEPTAGVDLEHQQILADVLQALLHRGIAILVVLHEIGPLAPLVDRAVVLREGRVVGDGPLSDPDLHSDPQATGHRADHGGHEHEPPAGGITPFPSDPLQDLERSTGHEGGGS